MSLRDYQVAAVSQLRQAVIRSGSAVYVVPTGSGKTVVAGEIARLAASKGSRTLLLVHRRELVKQAVDTLHEACDGLQVGVEAAGWPSMPWAKLQVGMVQSLVRRDYDLDPALVIIDEAHHARAKTWERVLQRWPRVPRLGLTATPQRLDGKGLGEHFAEMILGPTIPELVKAGWLAPTRTLRLPYELTTSGVKRNRHGEYQQTDLAKRVTSGVIANGVDAYMRYAHGRAAIFFGVHVDHSRRVCAGLRERGVRAEHVDGTDSPARRDRVMNALKTGGLDVVGNCDLISEGFDAPGCEVVIMGAPTRSVTRYLQMAGRAMRPGPDKEALILDLGGSSHELGLPDDVRQWTLEDGEVDERPAMEKEAAVRECPSCHTLFYGRHCPHCQYEAPLNEVPDVVTELEDARTGRAAPAKRTNGRAPRGSRRAEVNRELAMARKAQDPKAAVIAIGKKRGYKPGWAFHILRVWGI